MDNTDSNSEQQQQQSDDPGPEDNNNNNVNDDSSSTSSSSTEWNNDETSDGQSNINSSATITDHAATPDSSSSSSTSKTKKTKRKTKRKTKSSLTSGSSSGSIGIGSVKRDLIQTMKSDLATLTPEGPTTVNEPVYDCIVYLIYCPEHDRIAVSNVEKLRCVWLPFVVLPENNTWKNASHEGVAILIGRQDPEMETEEAEKTAPVYTMSYLHILRIQLPPNRMVLRLTQFVQLQNNPDFKCCENSMRVHWVPSSDILNNRIEKVWGPELKILSMMLVSSHPQIISEFTLDNSLYYLNLNDSHEQLALWDHKLNQTHVHAIYNDYVRHCYPSFYMCFESYRSYFIKHGHQRNETHLKNLFRAFSPQNRKFIDFHDFLIGLVVMEPNATNSLEARTRLIFRYYDFESKGQLNSQNVHQLLKDIYPSYESRMINSFLEILMRNVPNRENIPYKTFVLLQTDFVNKLINLCRSPHSILSQILKKKSQPAHHRHSLKSIRKTEGTCRKCRAQQYQYGNHGVTIDTIGRCVEPKIISRDWFSFNSESKNNLTMTRFRFSLEYVFSISSVPNIFIDLVLDFYNKKYSNLPGLMSAPEDRSIFSKYFAILCRELANILEQEDKLIKINAPALVVGDLHGSLGDLITIGQHFFSSFPVIPESLIFLGNYSGGECSYGIECLIYLFSLKLIAPNKVILLRGKNEIIENAQIHLQRECLEKYGDAEGPIIYSFFLEMFALLPVAVIVDENIVCLHSGIPFSNDFDSLYRLPKQLAKSEMEASIVYEIINRCPKKFINKKPNRNNRTKNETTKSSLPEQSSSRKKRPNNNNNSKRSKKDQSSDQKTKSSSRSKSHRNRKSGGGKRTKSSKRKKSLELSKSLRNNHNNNEQQNLVKQTKSFQSLTKELKSRNLDLKTIKDTKKNQKNIDFVRTKSTFKNQSLIDRGKDSFRTCIDSAFTQNELTTFLYNNDLSYLIRSHSACAQGYRIEFSQKCLTIFSCSNYQSLKNEAAVALIDSKDCTIRFIRFSTKKKP